MLKLHRKKIIGTSDILQHEVKVFWAKRPLFIPCKFGNVDRVKIQHPTRTREKEEQEIITFRDKKITKSTGNDPDRPTHHLKRRGDGKQNILLG